MAPDRSRIAVPGALAPIAPGQLCSISHGDLRVEIAPQAGGRIAQIRYGGVDHLVGYGVGTDAAIAWGCFPMVPWAGRIRRGRFEFDGRGYQLPRNLGEHAIHGVGFSMPWAVVRHETRMIELSLELPEDARWPFGGTALQRITVGPGRLEMVLRVQAGERRMPAVIGWHPWFRKPDDVVFTPTRIFPRDDEGIATLPLQDPPSGPWDDCFINHDAITLRMAGRVLRLASDCQHWVYYDELASASCIEPQSGPPDAFNLHPDILLPGSAIQRHFTIDWLSPR